MEDNTTVNTAWLQDMFAQILNSIQDSKEELRLEFKEEIGKEIGYLRQEINEFRLETNARFDKLERRYFVSEQITETMRLAVKEGGELFRKV